MTNAKGKLRKMKSGLCAFCAITAALTTAEAVETIPYLDPVPSIDGKISEGEWAQCKPFTLVCINGAELDSATEVRVGQDGTNLYVLFDCKESDMSRVRRQWRTPEERDNDVWRDDCVEILVDPYSGSNTADLRQFSINSNSIVLDMLGGNRAYNAAVNAKAGENAEGWHVEIAIPLADLGYKPLGNEVWKMNFGRNKTVPAEYSDLKVGTTHAAPSASDFALFEDFRFEPAPGKNVPFTLEKIDGIDTRTFHLRFAEDAPPESTVTITTLRENGKAALEPAMAIAKAGEECILTAKAHPEGAILRLQVADGDNVYYGADVDIRKPSVQKQQAGITENPLFEELQGDEPMGLVKDGAMFWLHGADPGAMRPIAMQYGFPWSEDEYYKIVADNDLLAISTHASLAGNGGRMIQLGKEYGFRFIFTPDYRMADLPKYQQWPLLIDPIAQETYFDDLENVAQYGDSIYAVYFGDELVNIGMMSIIAMRRQSEYDNYQFLQDLDQQVKERYGFGKYGIPESDADPNVFRWIAFRHFMNDTMLDLMKRTRARVREINPDLKVISDDPVAAINQVYDYEMFDDSVCDIITHQLYPFRSPDVACFSYITKYLSDLSSVKELWPCTHVEEYGASYTPMETLEKLSETVRAGATGLHYYLVNTTARRSNKQYLHAEFYGAPDRWQVEREVLQTMQTMNKLKFPEPDSAIFMPMDTLRAAVGYNAAPYRSRTLHSLLEIQAKAYFKYFNETSLEKGEDLSGYKVVFVPDAKYLRREAIETLRKYVENGGKVVVGDPEAFSFTPAGEDLSEVRKSFLGIAAIAPDTEEKTLDFDGEALPAGGIDHFVLTPAETAEIVGTYDSGKPAVICNRVGKGEVITFGVNLGSPIIVGNKLWQKFFRKYCGELGLKLDQDIWRFRFPEEIARPLPMPKGYCLTGNSVEWRECKPVTKLNFMVPDGSYSYSIQPDKPGEKEVAASYAFGKGKLVNRLEALKAGNVSDTVPLSDFIVGFSQPEAFAITFDLGEERTIDRVEMFFCKNMRPVEMSFSCDGEIFGDAQAFPVTEEDNRLVDDVRRKTLQANGQTARYVRLNFAEVPQDKALLELAEIEIWTPREE